MKARNRPSESRLTKRCTMLLAASMILITLCSCAGSAGSNTSLPDVLSTADVLSPSDNVSCTDTQYPDGEIGSPEAVFIGEWYDINSRRAHMYITEYPGDGYEVRVSWGSSAWSATEWLMHAIYDAELDCLVYEDGTSREVVYRGEEDDPEITTYYIGSSGTVRHDRERLVWRDSKDSELASNRVFLRIDEELGVIWPEDLDILGHYTSPGGERMEINYRSDGNFGVFLVLPGAPEIYGSGVYDEQSRIITATADDGSDSWKTRSGTIELSVTFGEDYSAELVVTKSDREYLPEGCKITFE